MDDVIRRAEQAKHGSPYLNTDRAAYYLGVSKRFLQQLRSAGAGPVHRRHSRVVQYHIDDLEAWSRSRAAEPRR